MNFLRHLKDRGLQGVQLFTSDKSLGLVETLGGVLSGSAMAAVHGALLPERIHCGAEREESGKWRRCSRRSTRKKAERRP